MMGSKRDWCIILVTISLYYSSSFVQAQQSYNSDSLDALIHDYASKEIMKHRTTGSLYKVPLPSNFSGMEVSVVRVRSGSFWSRGANYNSFSIPPRIVPFPFVKRIAIVYQDLGNWSDSYYNVQGYRLVSSVVGFFVYDASNINAIGNVKLNLSIMGDAISVRFPRILDQENGNATLKCVRFGDGGVVEMSNMTAPNACLAQDQGHFSIAVPAPNEQRNKKKKVRFWKWWVIGFGGGFVVLVLLGLLVVLIFKMVRRKRIKEMERQSEKGVSLNTMSIGESKLPSAYMIRTQPSIENEYVP